MDRRSRLFKPFYDRSLFCHDIFTKRSQMYHEFGGPALLLFLCRYATIQVIHGLPMSGFHE